MKTLAMCEACRREPAVLEIENEVKSQPFRVCFGCGKRLQNAALRPLEWFNLAAIHCPNKYWLCYDFYDHDGQGNQSAENAVLHPAPTLAEVRQDRERLLDFAFSRHGHIDEPLCQALRLHNPSSILESLKDRVGGRENVEITVRAYTICARAVGPVGASWIRHEWSRTDDPYLVPALGAAAASCLPVEEAFCLVCQRLERMSGDDATHSCYALAYFKSERTLDWMEAHADLVRHSNWARVAALSGMTWDRLQSWLKKGRPLSHRALETLMLALDRNGLGLPDARVLNLPSATEIGAALDHYYAFDPVANVRKKSERIKQLLASG